MTSIPVHVCQSTRNERSTIEHRQETHLEVCPTPNQPQITNPANSTLHTWLSDSVPRFLGSSTTCQPCSPIPSEKRRRGPLSPAVSVASSLHIWRSFSRRIIFYRAASSAVEECVPATRSRCAAAPPLPPPQPPLISVWRLRRHRGAEDCWLAAHGAVYDVTLLLKRHPGGERVLLKRAGGDCSEDFDFHSAAGREMWARYRIGALAPQPAAEAANGWRSGGA